MKNWDGLDPTDPRRSTFLEVNASKEEGEIHSEQEWIDSYAPSWLNSVILDLPTLLQIRRPKGAAQLTWAEIVQVIDAEKAKAEPKPKSVALALCKKCGLEAVERGTTGVCPFCLGAFETKKEIDKREQLSAEAAEEAETSVSAAGRRRGGPRVVSAPPAGPSMDDKAVGKVRVSDKFMEGIRRKELPGGERCVDNVAFECFLCGLRARVLTELLAPNYARRRLCWRTSRSCRRLRAILPTWRWLPSCSNGAELDISSEMSTQALWRPRTRPSTTPLRPHVLRVISF